MQHLIANHFGSFWGMPCVKYKTRSVDLHTGVVAVLGLLKKKKSCDWILSLVLKMCHNKNHNSFSPFPPCSKTQIWSQSFSVIPLQPVYLTCGQVSFLFLASESFHLSPKISTFYHGAGTQLLWPMFWFRPRAWLLFKKVKLGKGRKGRQNTPEIKLIENLSKILMKGLF